ncbi:integrin beta pat-3 [Bicyclus anynana]|uniref:Integrin beta pat-3 n=1 Tax=Bicyclus anynana TaxID=110368 RepID=A0A6J1NWS8_BICAN|nr:integrin beta pat-3 [Bicyclus anynana]
MGNYNRVGFYLCISIYILAVSARHGDIYNLDESWICNIKRSCVDCLRLSQCSWCRSENKCFSEKLSIYNCKEDKVQHVNYGLSLEENAKCACDPENAEQNCRHPDVTDVICSGRGICICGRCSCNMMPDPSKTIMGEYCEYDNYSCNDTKCNEGPYNIYELQTNEENIKHNGD